MTNAHRPTWKAAVGGSEQGGNILYIPTRQYSSRDMPSHLTLKTRQLGQGTEGETKKIDFKNNILERERKYFSTKGKEGGGMEEIGVTEDNAPLEEEEELYTLEKCIESLQKSEDEVESVPGKKKHVEQEDNPFPQDEDVDFSSADEKFESVLNPEAHAQPNNEEEGDDENAELMREFEKVKKEREEDQKHKVILFGEYLL